MTHGCMLMHQTPSVLPPGEQYGGSLTDAV